MSKKGGKKVKGDITPFLTPRVTRLTPKPIDEDIESLSHVQPKEKMATGGKVTVTNEDLQTLIKEMRTEMNNKIEAGFTDIKTKVDTLTVTVSGLEKDIAAVRLTQEKDREDIENVKKDMSDITETLNEISSTDIGTVQKSLEQIIMRLKTLEISELENSVYSRKYNLMVHGIPGKETDNAITENKIRDFAKESLLLDPKFSENVLLSNCHRLPKKSNSWGQSSDSDPIVVKFVKWADREIFLKATRNLGRNSKIRVRTHLPAVLAKARAKLSTTAYTLRQEGTYARVRERGTSITMDIKEGPMGRWTTEKRISAEHLINERNDKL
jgi:hypothetical protein